MRADAEVAGALPPVRAGRSAGMVPADAPLDAALGVAERVAERHGGEIQLRSRADGSPVVELRFAVPRPPA